MLLNDISQNIHFDIFCSTSCWQSSAARKCYTQRVAVVSDSSNRHELKQRYRRQFQFYKFHFHMLKNIIIIT